MAKYEVHIPGATPGTPNVTFRVFADNWMAALKTGMEKVGEQGSQMANILCDILEDGSIDVTDPKTARVFRIIELEGSDEATPVSGAHLEPVRTDADREEATDPELSMPAFAGDEDQTETTASRGGDDEKTPVGPIPLEKLSPPPPAKPAPKEIPRPRLEIVPESKPGAKAPLPSVDPPTTAAKPSAKAATGKVREPQMTQLERPTSKPRLVEQIDEPSGPIKGPIGRPISMKEKKADPEEVFAELFEKVQEAEALDRPKAMYFFLDLALQKIPAESGSVLLAPLGATDLRFAAARGPKSEELLKLNPKVPIGKGIAGFVAQESVAVAVSDAPRDKRWLRQISDRVGYETRSIICAPMAVSGKTYGCLQVLNRRGNARFEDAELAILSYVAHQAAKYVESHGG